MPLAVVAPIQFFLWTFDSVEKSVVWLLLFICLKYFGITNIFSLFLYYIQPIYFVHNCWLTFSVLDLFAFDVNEQIFKITIFVVISGQGLIRRSVVLNRLHHGVQPQTDHHRHSQLQPMHMHQHRHQYTQFSQRNSSTMYQGAMIFSSIFSSTWKFR